MIRIAKATTRPLLPSELRQAYEWAVGEDWNPGESDASVFLSADPGSLLTLDVRGKPAGVISALRMTSEFGFMGFFVLPPEHRRSIHAWTLWHAALERMGDRVIGGEGVLDRLHNYAHYGFQPACHTISHQGVAPLRSPDWHAGVELAAKTPLAQLAAYDAANFGVPRNAVLKEWLSLPASRALVFKREDRICGLGSARCCHSGIRIGPLQADDPEAAEALLDALLGLAPGEPVSIDCPENNPEAARLMKKKGLVAGSATARIYRGEPPAGLPHRLYGLMSFALG